ncbi:hypothetical protein [Demequina maris]|uniref:hypothetical protein n=1 Tax=Demequina maris TaxID=1638982 RepID=UPI0007814761|nr:hypothetical protein [Demequina maris]
MGGQVLARSTIKKYQWACVSLFASVVLLRAVIDEATLWLLEASDQRWIVEWAFTLMTIFSMAATCLATAFVATLLITSATGSPGTAQRTRRYRNLALAVFVGSLAIKIVEDFIPAETYSRLGWDAKYWYDEAIAMVYSVAVWVALPIGAALLAASVLIPILVRGTEPSSRNPSTGKAPA